MNRRRHRVSGQRRMALASNARYYPNGALAQFSYGNGIVHTLTQNARQLPSRSVDGSVLNKRTGTPTNQ